MKAPIIVVLFTLLSTAVFAQNQSVKDLGQNLCKALNQNDKALFKTLVPTKEIALELMQTQELPGVTAAEKETQLAELSKNYDKQMVKGYEDQFDLTRKNAEKYKVSFDDLTFEVVSQAPAQLKSPQVIIHSELNNGTYKHMYFYAMQFGSDWYLASPAIRLSPGAIKFK